MGELYLVYDRTLHQLMAMKTPKREYLDRPGYAGRFLQEVACIIGAKRCENVVIAYFAKYIEGRPCLFMEYIEGDNLRNLIGRLNMRSSLHLLIQVCAGMVHLHEFMGITHRDLKPENILITTQGIVKIMDFGLADFFLPKRIGVRREEDSEADSRLMGGSYPYMPPEQWTGNPSGKWSDVYSFGIIMYEILTGRMPFSGDSKAAWRRLHLEATPESPSNLSTTVPKDIDKLVMSCLEKDISRRPPNFADIADTLEGVYRHISGEEFGASFGSSNVSLPRHGGSDKVETNWEVLLERGVIAFREGRTTDAIQDFLAALKLYPSSYDGWFNLGNATARVGNHHAAVDAFQHCCGLLPNKSQPHSNMANSYIPLGDFASAVKEFEEALRLDPNDRVAKINLPLIRDIMNKR